MEANEEGDEKNKSSKGNEQEAAGAQKSITFWINLSTSRFKIDSLANCWAARKRRRNIKTKTREWREKLKVSLKAYEDSAESVEQEARWIDFSTSSFKQKPIVWWIDFSTSSSKLDSLENYSANKVKAAKKVNNNRRRNLKTRARRKRQKVNLKADENSTQSVKPSEDDEDNDDENKNEEDEDGENKNGEEEDGDDENKNGEDGDNDVKKNEEDEDGDDEKKNEGDKEHEEKPEEGEAINYGNFAYKIVGTYNGSGNLHIGKTSRSSTMWGGDDEEEITVVTLLECQEARDYTCGLRLFQNSSFISNLVYMNENSVPLNLGDGSTGVGFHVLIDKIFMDMNMARCKAFGNRTRNWVDSKEKFKRIFHGIMLGLSQVFRRNDYSVPRLSDIGTISVDKGWKSKIAIVVKGDFDHNRCDEINDLGACMFNFLTSGVVIPVVGWNTKRAELFKRGVPLRVINFIYECCDRKPNRSCVPTEYLLDFSFFWPWDKMAKWIKLVSKTCRIWANHDHFLKHVDKIFRRKMIRKLWKSFLPKSGRIADLFKEFEIRSTAKPKTYFRYEFFCVLRFYRNVLVHYNDAYLETKYKHLRRSDSEICIEFDSYFDGGGLCIILRETIKEVFFLSNVTLPPSANWWSLISDDMLAALKE